MAEKNWWEEDSPHKNEVRTGVINSPSKKDWWEDDTPSSGPPRQKKPIPRDYSIFERTPLVGGYVSDYKENESKKVDELDKKFPGYRSAYYGNKKIEDLATDMAGSFATSAVTGPGMLLNMGAQGVYGAASRAKDLIAEKGSNFGWEDAGDVAKTGGISSLGPIIGKIFSPTSKATIMPKPSSPEVETAGRPTFESIKATLRGENNSPELSEFLHRRWAQQQQEKIAETAHNIGQGIERYKDSFPNALNRAFYSGALPFMMGGHPALTAAAAAGGAIAPHAPELASKYWHNQMNPAILQSLLTSGAINQPQ